MDQSTAQKAQTSSTDHAKGHPTIQTDPVYSMSDRQGISWQLVQTTRKLHGTA